MRVKLKWTLVQVEEEIPNGSMLVWLMKKIETPSYAFFCDKVTKGGIYRHKQHLVGRYGNAKKCRKCPEHVREEMEEYMSSKKNKKKQMNMGSEDVNEDLFGLEDEDFGEEINSRMNVSNISSRGSNR